MKNIHIHLNAKAKDSEINYIEGRFAAAKGVNYDANPYRKGTSECLDWSKGHNQWRVANNKAKDVLERINLSQVLAKFPSLKSYGLLSVYCMNGEIAIVSTYNVPKEMLQELKAFVKTIKTVT